MVAVAGERTCETGQRKRTSVFGRLARSVFSSNWRPSRSHALSSERRASLGMSWTAQSAGVGAALERRPAVCVVQSAGVGAAREMRPAVGAAREARLNAARSIWTGEHGSDLGDLLGDFSSRRLLSPSPARPRCGAPPRPTPPRTVRTSCGKQTRSCAAPDRPGALARLLTPRCCAAARDLRTRRTAAAHAQIRGQEVAQRRGLRLVRRDPTGRTGGGRGVRAGCPPPPQPHTRALVSPLSARCAGLACSRALRAIHEGDAG